MQAPVSLGSCRTRWKQRVERAASPLYWTLSRRSLCQCTSFTRSENRCLSSSAFFSLGLRQGSRLDWLQWLVRPKADFQRTPFDGAPRMSTYSLRRRYRASRLVSSFLRRGGTGNDGSDPIVPKFVSQTPITKASPCRVGNVHLTSTPAVYSMRLSVAGCLIEIRIAALGSRRVQPV